VRGPFFPLERRGNLAIALSCGLTLTLRKCIGGGQPRPMTLPDCPLFCIYIIVAG
jgi:hypothetical protein